MTYKDVAGDYLRKGWYPIPVQGKAPIPAGCTGENGTVDGDKVFQWTLDQFWGAQNVALRADGWIGIDVDDYERLDPATGEMKVKSGAAQLSELEARLGQLPVTISSTARGQDSPSRQYMFRLPEGEARTAFATKPAADIEIIQHRHRYMVAFPSVHPETHLQYAFYDYEGELLTEIPTPDDLEMLPEAWIEFLRAPERDETEGFSGNIDAWLDILPDGDPDAEVMAFIFGIPSGEFDHTRMVELTYHVVRLGSEGHPGIRRAVEILRAAWLRGPYDTPEYRDDFSKALDGAIRKAGALEEPEVEGHPEPLSAAEYAEIIDETLGALAATLPDERTSEHLETHFRTLITAGKDKGFGDRELMTLAVRSAIIRHLELAPADVWQRIQYALKPAPASPVEAPSAVAVLPDPVERVKYIEFLRPEERELVAACDWWGSRYLTWAKSQIKFYNPAYHRMMMWTVLSLALAPLARIPIDAKDVPLNLFGMILGPTTSGKTESKDLARKVLSHCAPEVNIGGDATPSSLIDKLLARDKQSSWFNADEAHGLFKEMQARDTWRAGLRERWTELYEGRVPMMLRNTKTDLSGFEATSYFTMTLMGTEEGMIDVLDAEFWTSGFLARFVWGIGETIIARPEDMRINIRRRPAMGGPGMAEQLGSELVAAREERRKLDGYFYMDLSEEAEERFNQFIAEHDAQVSKSRNFERLKPTSVRFRQNVLKCAALVALSEAGRSPVIDLRHLLIALDQAGEWWANILYVSSATDETVLVRDVSKLEQIVAREFAGEMPKHMVYRKSPRRRKRDTDELVDQLVAEGRADWHMPTAGEAYLRLKGGTR